MGPSVILVIQHDEKARLLVSRALEHAGFVAVDAPDGRQGLRRFFEVQPDLVVLDTTVPEDEGFEMLQRIRDLSDLPVLVLTNTDGELEKVRALRGGADDYVTKPFGRLELVARIETLLRRSTEATRPRAVLSDALVTIDFVHTAVTVAGKDLTLTPLEFRLLATFVRHRNHVLSAAQIAQLVWGEGGGSRDQVKLYVSYLRRRLRETASVEPIETVRGFGYRYRPRPPAIKTGRLESVAAGL